MFRILSNSTLAVERGVTMRHSIKAKVLMTDLIYGASLPAPLCVSVGCPASTASVLSQNDEEELKNIIQLEDCSHGC